MPTLQIGRIALATFAALAVGTGGWLVSSVVNSPVADMRLEPRLGSTVLEQLITVTVVVESSIPVNVFQGVVKFDSRYLVVEKIDYNTSIADLWAEEPWYSNGDGTIGFIGGTTKPGGFTDTGELIKITFKTKALGDTKIAMSEARILQHDGLGTDVTLNQPIDALFSITNTELSKNTVISKSVVGPDISILDKKPTTDLNKDGQHNMKDFSIFMGYLTLGDLRADFNQDGRVSMADMSIIIEAIQ